MKSTLTNPFTQKDLHESCCTECGDPTGTLMEFVPRCHPDSLTRTGYERATGQIVVVCAVCKSGVARIKVAV
jgi:hypothetical protein